MVEVFSNPLPHVILNHEQLEEFNKLQELLKDLRPEIGRVDRNVEKLSKEIEGGYANTVR